MMWYYALDGERKGPVEKEEVQSLINNGDLGVDDLVWRDGMDGWTRISEVEDFQPSPPPLPQDDSSTSSVSGSDDSTHTSSGKGLHSSTSVRNSSSTTSNSRERDTDTDVYAGFGRRLVAYVIDVAILVLFMALIGAIMFAAGMSLPESTSTPSPLGFLITWMYFALNESSGRQATWGKQLMGLKVTDLNGNKIGFWKATGRHFGKIISSFILFIGFIMAAFTEKKQALHDKMAGCLVVRGSVKAGKRPLETKKRHVEKSQQDAESRTVDGSKGVHIRRKDSYKSKNDKFNLKQCEKSCPSCGEYIKLEASGCRFCGYKFSSKEVEDQIKEARRPDAEDIDPSEIKATNDGEHCTVCGEKCSNWGNPQIRICEYCIEIPGIQERASKFDYD